MADYAKKGKPNSPVKGRSKNKGKGKPEPKNNGPRIWFMLMMAAALLGGFFYFLFYIDGKADETPIVVAEKNVKSVTKPTSALPKVPAKKWQYIDQLKDKEVIIDVADQPTSSHQYRVQCASYRSQRQADSLKAKIAFQGYASSIRQVKGSSSDWYQVSLGPFKTRRLAEAARHRMQRARINGCKIYYWQD